MEACVVTFFTGVIAFVLRRILPNSHNLKAKTWLHWSSPLRIVKVLFPHYWRSTTIANHGARVRKQPRSRLKSETLPRTNEWHLRQKIKIRVRHSEYDRRSNENRIEMTATHIELTRSWSAVGPQLVRDIDGA